MNAGLFNAYVLSLVACDVSTNDEIKKPSNAFMIPKAKGTNEIMWSSCPINITGGISGSSNSEVIKINVHNTSSKDIDSIKLMFIFTHTNYDNSQEQITGFFTLDTIWKDGSISKSISGESYNFLRASIYPVCVYFKDGTTWGTSSTISEEIIKNSVAFELSHFALTYENNQTSTLPHTIDSKYTIDDSPQGILNTTWISVYELKELSGEPELQFNFFPYFIPNEYGSEVVWVATFTLTSQLSGTVKKELLHIYDMPEDFSGTGEYSGINFKYENGYWYFKPQDLVSVGLLNPDGSFNSNFPEQEFDSQRIITTE